MKAKNGGASNCSHGKQKGHRILLYVVSEHTLTGVIDSVIVNVCLGALHAGTFRGFSGFSPSECYVENRFLYVLWPTVDVSESGQ